MVRYVENMHSSLYEEVQKAYPLLSDTGCKSVSAILSTKVLSLQELGYNQRADDLLDDLRVKMPLRWLRKKYDMPITMRTVLDSEGR